jgi:hypothetical protein
MKKLLFPLFIFPLLAQNTYAQSPAMEFGKISQDEINMRSYPADPQAEAVVLFDLGDSRFLDTEEGYIIQFTRIRRVKILTGAGIKYSEISIPIYHKGTNYEIVKSIEAFSYNFVDGRQEKTPLDQKTVFNEKINEFWDVKKFAMPDVRQGTIIEYKYVVETPYHFNLPDWEFQDKIPTVYSKYTVRMIPFYEYVYIIQGVSKFNKQESREDPQVRSWGNVTKVNGQIVGSGIEFHDLIHIFEMKNIPAFRDEMFITSISDYLIKIDFQLAKFHSPYGGTEEIISTWPLLIDGLLKENSFGKYMNSCSGIAKNILKNELSVESLSELEKCKTIISYIKSKYSWNGYSGVSASTNAKDVVNQRKGNVAEINLLLSALLKSAGIDASPVILSTRDHGKIKTDYPFLSFFNYVVVFVQLENSSFLADGSDFFTQYNRIPPKCINDKGLVIKKEEEKWISLNIKDNSVDQKTIFLTIDTSTFHINTSLNIQASEYDSYMYKKDFSNDTIKIKKYLSDKGVDKVLKIVTLNYDQSEKPYTISCSGISEVEKLDNKIIISPFLNFVLQINELTQSTRSYPVDFTYSKSEVYKTYLNIPSGYKVLALPQSQNIDNDIVEIKLNYSVADGLITIDGAYRFKKAVYEPTEYSRLKSSLNTIIKAFNDPIVLEKV